MEETNSLIEQRKQKLASLRAKGIDPFKNKFAPKEKCNEARAKYVRGETKEGQEVELAGRITAHRDMGKSMFIDIKDQSGRIQVYAQKNVLGDDKWSDFTHLDLGDFIGVKGTMFTTKTGEPSVKLVSFVILGKALRPPPEKWHGLVDTEIRYRQRYLDLIACKGDPANLTTGHEAGSAMDVFLKRSAIVREIRSFFHGRGYVEVETPMMQAIPGGAAAQPFKTFHNALGCEFYLRIALELYHKRLLVGGVDKLFEIGKNFRNEGLSRKHNPEFTMLEAYEAYGDYETMMETVEALITTVAKKVVGTLTIVHGKKVDMSAELDNFRAQLFEIAKEIFPNERKEVHEDFLRSILSPLAELESEFKQQRPEITRVKALELIDKTEVFLRDQTLKTLSDECKSSIAKRVAEARSRMNSSLPLKEINLESPWRRARYKDLVKEKAGADWFDVSPAERRRRAIEDLKLGGDIAAGYEDFEVTGAIFEKLIEPTLINPVFVTHLPKELVPLAKLSPDDPTTVEVFECCINGQEVAPGYTEQNDAIAQRDTLEHQAGGEQQKLDEDFLAALEHGMPPAGGIGIGIDRLCMMLLGQESIRDVILFPQMKPK
jgi:lysyl-tRNA synthetase